MPYSWQNGIGRCHTLRLRNPEDGYGLAVMQDSSGLSACVENCKVEDFDLMPEACRNVS